MAASQGDDPALPGESAVDSSWRPAALGASIDWDGLPGPVAGRLAELGGAALGSTRQGDVPAPLRPVMRFAPAKRAKLGRASLVTAIRDSTVFRAAVVDWCRTHRPEALELDDPDPVVVAAAALLVDSPRAPHYVELVGYRVEQGQLRTERDSAVARADKLTAEVQRLRTQLAEAEQLAESAGQANNAEADRLRKRLREQGVRRKEANDAAAAARDELARLREETEATIAEVVRERDREREQAGQARQRAERASADADVARHSAREARQGDEVRLALLLETVEGALTGLRRELGASGRGGPLPADAAQRGLARTGGAGGVADIASLDRLLTLPAVHLIVDGYNVTKSGYPDLPLSDQRDRLAHQLAALVSRTGAEVTLVFDGADVLSVPSAGPRGVRVLFSASGVQADDVIRGLVEAEPQGRQLIVVTSDRAVVDSVRSRGAYTVSSNVLLQRVNRV